MNELEAIKTVIDNFKPSIIIEEKIDIIEKIYPDGHVYSIDHLGKSERKVFFCKMNHFHISYLDILNEGDIIGIYEYSGDKHIKMGYKPYEHSLFQKNGFSTRFWIKSEESNNHIIGNSNNDYVVPVNDDVRNFELSRSPIMDDVDVLITASSRRLLIPYCIKSFKQGIYTKRHLRWLLHEDFVFPEESKKVLEWAKFTGYFDVIEHHKKNVGLGYSLYHMIPMLKSKYTLYIQDDWELERPVDLDEIIWVMECNKDINLVIFNKFKNFGSIGGFDLLEHTFESGLKLCLYNAFALLPGIWRTDFVKKRYTEPIKYKPEGTFTNSLGTHKQRLNGDYCRKNLGAYFYGGTGDFRYVRHLGNNWRMASWQLENGNPGGNPAMEASGEQYRAPWVPFKDRPIYDGRNLK